MTVTSSTCGVWALDDAYKKIQAGCWVQYNRDNDPGEIYSWGYNGSGQLGQNDTIHRSSPVQIPGNQWVKIFNGSSNFFATKLDNSLWVWGTGLSGRLGDNTTINKSSPIQLPGNQWSKICGNAHTLGIKSDGSLWVWGDGGSGRLGDNTTIPKSSPIQVPGTQWCEVSASAGAFSMALKTDGTLWSWGYNGQGNLGHNNTINQCSPVQVPGTTWTDVSIGNLHSTATKSDGTLWQWGRNNFGQIGINGSINYSFSSPRQIPGVAWNNISSGVCETYASKTDGTLWAWGNGCTGTLGTNTTIHRSSPSQIPGTEWNDFKASSSAGCRTVIARKTDNTLWMWGFNTTGQLGVDDTIHRSSPVQIPGTNWEGPDRITNGSTSFVAFRF